MEPSLCIQRAFASITEEEIVSVFNNLKVGTIKEIIKIPKVNYKGEPYNSFIIHMEEWNESDKIEKIREQFMLGFDFKLIHEDPNSKRLWKVSITKLH
jgi:hypothetical protein